METQNGDAPCIFHLRVECDVILEARQRLPLSIDGEHVRDLLTNSLPQLAPKAAHGKSVFVELLPAVSRQIVAAQETFVGKARIGVRVFGNDKPHWAAHWLAMSRLQ